jgi:hypothetical protein
MKSTLCISLCLVLSLARGEEPEKKGPAQNYYEATKHPPAPLDKFTQSVLDQLANSRVPTADEAGNRVFQELVQQASIDGRNKATDPRESMAVTGLYRLAPVEWSSAKEGELVWEVRLVRVDAGLSGVFWVSCSTGTVRTLFR